MKLKIKYKSKSQKVMAIICFMLVMVMLVLTLFNFSNIGYGGLIVSAFFILIFIWAGLNNLKIKEREEIIICDSYEVVKE